MATCNRITFLFASAAMWAAFLMPTGAMAESAEFGFTGQMVVPDIEQLRGPAGPEGPRGVMGPVGPQGEPGIAPSEVQDILDHLEDLEGRVTVLEGTEPEPEPEPEPSPGSAQTSAPIETVNAASTTHAVNMPPTINAGDLLKIYFQLSGDVSVTETLVEDSGDWLKLWSVPGGSNKGLFAGFVFVPETQAEADALAGGAVTFTSNVATASVAHAYRITDWAGDLAGVAAGVAAHVGTGANPNPPSLTVPWEAAENLWFAAAGCIDDDAAATTAPADYGDLVSTTSGAGIDSGAMMATARRETATATEDPGPFTLSESERCYVNTVVVAPAGAELPAEDPEPDPDPEPEPDPEPDPPQTGELPEGAITPQQFGATCDGVADDSSAVDATLNEALHRNVAFAVPAGSHCQAENVAERNLQDAHLYIAGTLDLGSRSIGWGIDAANFTIEGPGKLVCDKPGGVGRTIAFIMAPQADYDSDGPTLDFSPSRTRDNEQITFDLAEWDGCQPLVLLNHHPVPVAYDPEKSQYSLKRLFFRGWVHDAQGGVILNTARYGDSQAMTIENGEIVAGAPAIEIHGTFENIDGRPCGKAGYCGRAIMIGSNREAPDTNGSVLISAHVDGVYGNDFHRNDGNEVQGIRLDNGHRAIIRDTLLAHVRHAGIHNDLDDGEQNRNQFNNYTNNTECLYDKYDDLWVINTTFRNCDGGGLDAHAWTAKSRGPVYGRNITFIWDHPSWTRWTCRGVRVPESGGDYIGVTVEGYPECRPWATEGDPNRDEVHFFRTPGVGDEDTRIFDLTFNGEAIN